MELMEGVDVANGVVASVASSKTALLDLFNRLFTKSVFDADTHIQSNITDNKSISLAFIALHPEVSAIASDLDLIRQCLHESKIIAPAAEDEFRPLGKPEQMTIILRDVSNNATLDDVLGLFRHPSATSARSDMNNTWFVNFNTEAEARVALENIRNASLDGKPLKARLKTESLTKSYFNAPPTNPSPQNSDFFQPLFSPMNMPVPPMMMPPQSMSQGMFYPGYPMPHGYVGPPGPFPMMGFPGMMPMADMGSGQNKVMPPMWSNIHPGMAPPMPQAPMMHYPPQQQQQQQQSHGPSQGPPPTIAIMPTMTGMPQATGIQGNGNIHRSPIGNRGHMYNNNNNNSNRMRPMNNRYNDQYSQHYSREHGPSSSGPSDHAYRAEDVNINTENKETKDSTPTPAVAPGLTGDGSGPSPRQEYGNASPRQGMQFNHNNNGNRNMRPMGQGQGQGYGQRPMGSTMGNNMNNTMGSNYEQRRRDVNQSANSQMQNSKMRPGSGAAAPPVAANPATPQPVAPSLPTATTGAASTPAASSNSNQVNNTNNNPRNQKPNNARDNGRSMKDKDAGTTQNNDRKKKTASASTKGSAPATEFNLELDFPTLDSDATTPSNPAAVKPASSIGGGYAAALRGLNNVEIADSKYPATTTPPPQTEESKSPSSANSGKVNAKRAAGAKKAAIPELKCEIEDCAQVAAPLVEESAPSAVVDDATAGNLPAVTSPTSGEGEAQDDNSKHAVCDGSIVDRHVETPVEKSQTIAIGAFEIPLDTSADSAKGCYGSPNRKESQAAASTTVAASRGSESLSAPVGSKNPQEEATGARPSSSTPEIGTAGSVWGAKKSFLDVAKAKK